MRNTRKTIAIILAGILAIMMFGISPTVFADTIAEQIAAGTTTIVLDADMTEDLDVPAGKTLTLDLNGKTLTSYVTVEGTLTIKDSGNGGKLVHNVNGGNAIEVNGGKLTVEGGTISNNGGYGIYGLNGAEITVTGGTITSLDSPIASNNMTGFITTTISGGTLNATQGPAVYMPTPKALTITGGTLNGGISVRMGKITISGGTINATKGEIDSYKNYYNYSGNAWFSDALYVWNGTYTTKDEGMTNDLDLTITGGTFNCANGEGTALAILDMGRVDQKSTVKISGTPTFTTDSDRCPIEVLSLEDMGVASPSAGYGTYAGKVDVKVSGGEYSSYFDYRLLEEGYDEYDLGNKTVVAPCSELEGPEQVMIKVGETSDLEIVLSDESVRDLLRINQIPAEVLKGDENLADYADSIKDEVIEINGDEVTALEPGITACTVGLGGRGYFVVIIVYEVKADDTANELDKAACEIVGKAIEEAIASEEAVTTVLGLTEEETQLVGEALTSGKTVTTEVVAEALEEADKEDVKLIEDKVEKGTKVAGYYDVSVILKVDGEELVRIKNLGEKIKVQLELPKDLPEVQKGFERTFSVLRVHDGKVEVVAEGLKAVDGKLPVETDKFSTYAIAYKDASTSNPETGDAIMIAVATLIIATLGIVVTKKIKK